MAQLSLLCLGDSYTIGEAVQQAQSWPFQLVQLLNASGKQSFSEPSVIAKTGWTTDELAQAIDLAQPAPADLVSLLIGVNNQYRGRTLTEYAGQFAMLLAKAISLAKTGREGVFAVSIPDWGYSAFAQNDARSAQRIGLEIDAFNGVASAICKAAGVVFVDITALSRNHNPALVASDGLHPSALAYAQWSRQILHALQNQSLTA